MRIAYVVAEYPSLTETFIVREMQALRDGGMDVFVFALARRRDVVAARQEGLPDERVRHAPRLPGRAALALHARRFRRHPRRWLADFFGAVPWHPLAPRRLLRDMLFFHRVQALAEFLECERIDHVHAQFAHVNARIAERAANLTETRFSIGTHAWDIYGQRRDEVARILAGAAFVSCCTEKGIAKLREILPPERHRDIVLARHGVSFPEIASRPGSRKLVLAVGRLVRKKGFCYLIDACHILDPKGLSLSCLLVGEGPLETPLRRMIEQLDLTAAVRIVGPMPHASVARLLADESGLFVLPSVVAPDGDRDGLPNVILEAMAAGVPVVTTTASAAAEAIKDGRNGCLVPPENPEALADAIERLLQHPAERERLGAAARETVADDFNPTRCVAALTARFEQRHP